MAKFLYNNAKNTSISHNLFKLNCGYYSQVLFKKEVNPYFRSCSAKKLAKELSELMKMLSKLTLRIETTKKSLQ